MEYNLGSNWASNFKSAEGVARGRFEITSKITPELYDTKSNYESIVSITKLTSSLLPILKTLRIYFIRVAKSGQTTIKGTQFSADD